MQYHEYYKDHKKTRRFIKYVVKSNKKSYSENDSNHAIHSEEQVMKKEQKSNCT